MEKRVSSELIAVGLIVVLVTALLTFVSCEFVSNPIRRSSALFLEELCPAGRMEGWGRIPPWYLLFSPLLWLWAIGLGSIVAGIALAFRGTGNGPQVAHAGRNGSAEARPRETLLMVGRETLGEGKAMTGEELRDFERRLRRSIEQRPLEESEDMLRQAIAELGTPLLLAAIEQPPDNVAIENWDGIAADMADARRHVPAEYRDKPWQSVILALVYRNDYADMFIKPSFALSAEMDRSAFEWRWNSMSNEQHRQWLASSADLAALPPNPHFRSYSKRERTRLTGLEQLRAVESWTVANEDRALLWPALSTARMLAAGIILLRFCQAAERYLPDPGLPGALPTFLTVDMAEWPMETNTIDYCIYAVRRVEGST